MRRVEQLNRGFRQGQLVSAAFSLGHGANDAQKTMGVILAVLIGSGHLAKGADVPLWVVLAAHTAIGLGHPLGGLAHREDHGLQDHPPAAGGRDGGRVGRGRDVVLHVGGGDPRVDDPHHHGAIVGVGASRRLSAVRWGIAARVVWAWVLTIPGAFAIAAVTSWLLAVVS